MSHEDVTYSDGRGSQFSINLFGATVTSWKIFDEEILFCSKNVVRDGSKPIRAGIPLVFPHFASWKLGPKHGFARIKQWKLTAETKNEEGPSWTFSLEDDEETRKIWNYRFKLDYTVQLLTDSLKTSLTVTNRGDEAFSFEALMHTYFKIENIYDAQVVGLQNLNYREVIKGGRHADTDEAITFRDELERVYERCQKAVVLYPDGKQRLVFREITASNFSNIVVWNPWNKYSDMPDEEYMNMVCVEPGQISEPVSLAAKLSITFSQTIKVGQKPSI